MGLHYLDVIDTIQRNDKLGNSYFHFPQIRVLHYRNIVIVTFSQHTYSTISLERGVMIFDLKGTFQ